jgi:membrane protease YdiL (CAAX protease family)
VSVPLQEIIFRSLLIPRLEMIIGQKPLLILFNALLFGLAHAIFGSGWFVAATFLLGIFWSWLFVKYRNLLVILPSHALVGAVFIVIFNI